jgi:hypothetical protein
METLLPRRSQESRTHDFLSWIFGKFKIMDTGINRGETSIISVDFPDNCQPWVEISKPTRWQRWTTRCELKEWFSFISIHLGQNIHKPLEAGTEKAKRISCWKRSFNAWNYSPFFLVLSHKYRKTWFYTTILVISAKHVLKLGISHCRKN